MDFFVNRKWKDGGFHVNEGEKWLRENTEEK